MFSLMPNASKVAFIALAKKLEQEGYRLLDCQVHNGHLESLGAREILREDFLEVLRG
jgi:leucyl/phenylalanyl-tRNA--protein transferase